MPLLALEVIETRTLEHFPSGRKTGSCMYRLQEYDQLTAGSRLIPNLLWFHSVATAVSSSPDVVSRVTSV